MYRYILFPHRVGGICVTRLPRKRKLASSTTVYVHVCASSYHLTCSYLSQKTLRSAGQLTQVVYLITTGYISFFVLPQVSGKVRA